jgi:hypothetical protein
MNPDLAVKYRELLTEMDGRRRYGLHIESIEVTQSIQHYRSDAHLTSAAGRGPDNSVRLIAGKPAWVRVYIRSGLAAPRVSGVTGELEILRGSFGGPFSHVVKLAPRNAPFVAVQNMAYATERGWSGYTLNFAVPPTLVRQARELNRPNEEVDIMCGYLRFRVTIQAPDWASDSMEVDLDVTLQQTLRVRGFLPNYFGLSTSQISSSSPPAIPVPVFFPAPGVASLRSTAALALQVLPVQASGVFSVAGIGTWNRPLDDNASNGGCSANWTALLSYLQEFRVEDGNRADWLYYGLLPQNTPVGANVGCGDDGLGAGMDQARATMLHELGHACGLIHAPCGKAGDTDPTYPAYEPYDLPWNTTLLTMTGRASIGEYGLDTSTGEVKSPATFRDYMSYCGPDNWLSLHNYRRLTDHPSLAPKNVCRPPSHFDDFEFGPWWWLPWHRIPDPPPAWLAKRRPGPERLISLIGTVRSPKEVEVTSVMRVDAFRMVQGGRSTAYTAELHGAEGKPVRGHRFLRFGPRAADAVPWTAIKSIPTIPSTSRPSCRISKLAPPS